MILSADETEFTASARTFFHMRMKLTRDRFFSQHGTTFVAPRKKALEMPSVPVLFESGFLVIHIFKR